MRLACLPFGTAGGKGAAGHLAHLVRAAKSDSVLRMVTTAQLIDYAQAVRAARRANAGAATEGTALELLMAPHFQVFVQRCLPANGVQVLPEYRRAGIGRPDIAFARAGQPARAFIELKVPMNALSPPQLRGHDRAQFRRFGSLPLWGFCNFHTIHLYERDKLRATSVILPAVALDPETSDAMAERLLANHDPRPFAELLEQLAIAPPPLIRNARELATALAHAARLARQIVVDGVDQGLPGALADVRVEFEKTLFSRPEAAGIDTKERDQRQKHELFASAFAQTLAFGLLLAREASAAGVDRNAYQSLPEGSLLRATLRALTQDEILDLLGVSFDVLRDTVNVFAPGRLALRKDHDPILYFYEDFLEIFDPDARERYGVFYTPVELVEFIVASTDAALREPMGRDGLADPKVLLLDPACGTGTFSVAALKRVAERTAAEIGEGAVPAAVTGLAGRLNALELLVGPYTVAHWRVGREVIARGGQLGERLPIWLGDTLAPAEGTPGLPAVLGFMAASMVAERQGADAVKAAAPILAILGNPPYRRLRKGEAAQLIGPWMDAMWEDLKAPVKRAGAGRSLNAFPDLYVAFWRWALWRLFEAPGATGRGVVSFVTNRGFLAGRAFGGLRLLLRERFDAIDILDLRGDHRGALPAGTPADENVFAIQAGVCVLTAWANGGKAAGVPARVRYADIWDNGAYRRRDKLFALRAMADGSEADQPRWRVLPQTGMTDLKPLGFAARDWPALDELFTFRSNGIVTYRDEFVYATRRAVLEQRIRDFLAMPQAEAARAFGNSASNSAGDALRIPLDAAAITRIGYRPLDCRWLYAKQGYVDRPRDDLQTAWGADNVALFSLEDGIGAGPAVWCHALKPDQHAFRGSYGGWVFPLRDHAAGGDGHRLPPALLAGLAAIYGPRPAPKAVFDAILALLSAPSYAVRFARDVEDAFPHVPFPATSDGFARAAALGAEIRALETFASAPEKRFLTARVIGRATGVTLELPPAARAFLDAGDGTGHIPLQADQSLRLSGVPEPVFRFAVSGYPVLLRWLQARQGDALDEAFMRELVDLVGRVAALLDRFAAADALLEAVLPTALGRAELGLPSPVPFGDGVVFSST
jgi:hypothetical protein